jgi:hypothetical protein
MLPNGEVIKAVLQPIDGVTWPYHLYYFDKDETSIFGEGLASIMRDDQDMLNAAVRMMLDNGALTSGPMVEIFLDLLATTERADEDLPLEDLVPQRTSTGHVQAAVRQIQLENNIEWLSKMAAMFEQNTDEVTAIPRYMTGENATTGAAGTSSGMSMLMGAANIVIKDLITSWDEGITRGFLQSLYRWNMKFNSDNSIKGDFDVKARGTASAGGQGSARATAERVRQQHGAPTRWIAPFVKRHKLLQRAPRRSEMTDVVKTEDEVKQEQESDEAQKQQQQAEAPARSPGRRAEAKAAKLMAEAEWPRPRCTRCWRTSS